MRQDTIVEIGDEFVGYRIEELIGRGGMGVVYRAYDLRLKRTVALKLMAPELALDEGFRERFSREAELAMALEHPNVVPIHDAGDVDGRLYLAMRLVEGTDLRALLRSGGALEPARATAVCGQVASALDAAHTRGLVHRDVKPSNVLLDENEHVYLADFGLSRQLGEQVGSGDRRTVGTPAYLAPEQIEGGVVDGRVDVYALGCLLFECLTGEIPYVRDSRLAVAWAHLEEDAPSASERRPGLPEAVDAVIGTAMAKEPGDRYPTCSALIAAAEEALELRRRARGQRVLLGVVALAILVGVAVFISAVVSDDAGVAVPPVEANTVVRIDPATNKVSAVVEVGSIPAAIATGGRTVWVHNVGEWSLTEIDATSHEIRRTTRLPITAGSGSRGSMAGPELAADAAGAWVVSVEASGRSYLTRVLPAPAKPRHYRLAEEPLAVGVGYGWVWVVARDARGHLLLRIDPGSGVVEERTRFPASASIDGLAVGLGSIWATASANARLFRIDPRSGRVTGDTDLGASAARPIVAFDAIWVGMPDHGGSTIIVDPGTLGIVERLGCCSPTRGYFTAGHGSPWTFDAPTGTVVRWNGQTYALASRIQVTAAPYVDGFCLTSIVSTADAVWVTVAPTFAC